MYLISKMHDLLWAFFCGGGGVAGGRRLATRFHLTSHHLISITNGAWTIARRTAQPPNTFPWGEKFGVFFSSWLFCPAQHCETCDETQRGAGRDADQTLRKQQTVQCRLVAGFLFFTLAGFAIPR